MTASTRTVRPQQITGHLRARNAQTRLKALAWAYAMPHVPHALQPARAAPGTRLALHQRLAYAPAEIIFGRGTIIVHLHAHDVCTRVRPPAP